MAAFPKIMNGAEPFYLKGNETVCILLHGFTGTPKEMRWLGDFLNKNSISVIAPRLPGHATSPEDMQRSTWGDWVSSIEDIYDLFKPQAERIFVVGLSMGGLLAGVSASYLKYDGLITISTPYEFPQKDWRLPFLKQLSILQPKIKKEKDNWHNPEAAIDHIDYPYYPTKSIVELGSLISQFQKILPSLSLPSLHIHSKKDESVSFDHLEKIYRNNGSKNKEMFIVENSGHVVIREPDRFQVFQKILNFINAV